MNYITEATRIKKVIEELTTEKILWLDTEVADWQTSNKRLSLIQVLAGNQVYILDVLDAYNLSQYFIDKIMVNPKIEKVFHNADFDLQFLGGNKANNVTCTLKIAKTISLNTLASPNRKLKTLATTLCNYTNVDTEEQASDWGQRPLTSKQLEYAKMDVIYLEAVHSRLLEITNSNVIYNHEPYSLNVTQVKIAFECPRLFYLHHHFGGKTLFSSENTENNIKGMGTKFHKLAKELINLIKQQPVLQGVEGVDIATNIEDIFYQQVFFSYLETETEKNPNEAIALHYIWQGLRKLIINLVKLIVTNSHFCQPDEVLQRTFVAEELSIENYFTLPNKSQQKIIGKLDSLVFNCSKNRLCVVEYKTYKPADPSAQLAQVALYSYMVSQQKQMAVDAAVYCLFPEFQEYYYNWENLQETVYKLIPDKLAQMQQWLAWEKGKDSPPPPPTPQPHLCALCPQQAKCQSYFR